MIALSTAIEEGMPEGEVLSVPWPCETKVLVERIEAAFLMCRRHPLHLLPEARGLQGLLQRQCDRAASSHSCEISF